MYYVPDGTEQCGYYECKECGSRFLDLRMQIFVDTCPADGTQLKILTVYCWRY